MSERVERPEGEATELEGGSELEIQSDKKEDEAQGGAPQDRVWVDLNEASETELEQLPGIGQVLAARIVDYRNENGAFDKAEDVVSVPGVSGPMYERIAGYLTVARAEDNVVSDPTTTRLEEETAYLEEMPAGEPEEHEAAAEEMVVPESPVEMPGALESPRETTGAGTGAGDEPAEMPEPDEGRTSIDSMVVPAPESPRGLAPEEERVKELDPEVPEFAPAEPVSKGIPGGCWSVILVGLLAAAAGALLALVALRMINGTLNFRAATTRDLQAEAIRLDGEIGQIHGSLDGVRERLGAIEEFGPRLEAVEADVDWLTGEMEAMQREMGRLDDDLALANDTLATLASGQNDLEENVTALQVQLNLIDVQVYSLQNEMDAVRQAAERFDSFLRGLDELLGETVGPPLEEPPSLPKAQPTVIPLSTPTP